MTEILGNVSWVEETAQAVRLARDAGEAQKQADLLQESQIELRKILSEFKALNESAAVVRGLNWEGRTPNPDLSRDVEEALRTLDSRPLDRVRRALDKFGKEVAESLKGHWNSHAAKQLGNVSDLLSLSETLSAVEGISAVSQELSATLGELARSQSSLPTNQSVELLTKAVELLEQLESSLKPDSVKRFLSAVARGGAPLESLTSDVIEWLSNHKSLDRFKIVAASPAGDSK
ncbi:hypothetical protein [Gordonia bronchialis]|uniref:hypothetical protein n=1 Tax=Gordonia bronchialis TaxID=2054 RepID=UPI002272161C|nr:hypothetical protein [Gordonia bronchialis]